MNIFRGNRTKPHSSMPNLLNPSTIQCNLFFFQEILHQISQLATSCRFFISHLKPVRKTNWGSFPRFSGAKMSKRLVKEPPAHDFIDSLVALQIIEIPGKCYLHITWKFQICPLHESSLHRCCRVFRTLHTRQGFCDALLRF